MSKKVIIVSYYWPPAGGIGVLRCLKIAKYLVQYGWEPVVFTSTPEQYEFLDPRNNADVPEGIEIIRIKAFNPTKIFKRVSGRRSDVPLIDIRATPATKMKWMDELGRWIRGNFFIPDARSFWIRPATKRIRQWLQSNHANAIFSDGPPHTNTVVATHIAAEFNLPWLADFQDPWTQVDYYEFMKIGRWAHRIHSRMEQRAFRYAQSFTIASPSWAEDLRSIGAKNVEVLYYGYDEADFTSYQSKPPLQPVIFHGGLLGDDRYPAPLVDAIKQLKSEEFEPLQDLEIRLAGGVSQGVVSYIKAAGLSSELKLLGMVSRGEVIQEISLSSLVLLPINQASNAKGRIPGKLFELIRSEKPILALGPVDGDVAQLLKQTGAGEIFAYDDVDGVKQFLVEFFSGRIAFPKQATLGIEELSNEAGARSVARYLDKMVAEAETSNPSK